VSRLIVLGLGRLLFLSGPGSRSAACPNWLASVANAFPLAPMLDGCGRR